MSNSMTRRSFLLSLSAGAGLATASFPTLGFAWNAIRFRTNGFSKSEKKLIGQAMNIIHSRFTSDQVRRNTYQYWTNGYHLKTGAWKASKLQYDNEWGGKENLLNYQLLQLQVVNQFPRVNLYAFNEKNNVWGRAYRKHSVVVRNNRNETFTVLGEFHVYLNRRHLNDGSRKGSSPNQWASVIAHEMLHNLGHLHGKGNYKDNQQIVLFQRSFYSNGKYVPSWVKNNSEYQSAWAKTNFGCQHL